MLFFEKTFFGALGWVGGGGRERENFNISEINIINVELAIVLSVYN